MPSNEIVIKGAREHNLKNVDLVIPRDKLIVFTGLSGSGKSSLAFDTIFADGQRRYIESLSSYARMFLGQMQKPDVDYIEGLSPTSIPSRAFLPRYPSTRRPRLITRVRRSAPSPRYTIISGFCMPESAYPTVPSAGER